MSEEYDFVSCNLPDGRTAYVNFRSVLYFAPSAGDPKQTVIVGLGGSIIVAHDTEVIELALNQRGRKNV